MSILIKGVDMPKDGCHHMICIYADGTVSTGGREYTAIPVPTPHGRLIDADETKEALRRAEALIRAFGYHNVIQTVSEVPTIIDAEEGAEE